jgi:hypothetical protein
MLTQPLLHTLTSLVPTSLWILAGFSGLAKHKSRYLTKLYSIITNCNYLKYRGICLKEVNVDFFIVIYLIVAYLQKSRFCFSDYLVAKGPVIHSLVGIRLVILQSPHPSPNPCILESRLWRTIPSSPSYLPQIHTRS